MNYSTISLTEWKQVGEGGNGTTYTCDKEPGIQTLTWSERFFLGMLAKSLFKVS